jgi:tetratricopeptide (TPR) repeat protein
MFLNSENPWSNMIRKIVISVWMIWFLSGSALAAQEKQLFETGIQYLKQERYESAITVFTELIDLNPQNSDAYKNRGVAHMKLAQYDQAIHDFEKTLEITPAVKGIYSNLGVAWYYKSDYKKAIENYDREIALSPASHYAYFNRAICWAELLEYGKSLQDIDQTLTLEPDFYLAHCLKGDLFLEINDIDAARSAYEKAIQIDPEQAYARTQLEKIRTSTAPAPAISNEEPETQAAPTIGKAGVKSGAQTPEKEKTAEKKLSGEPLVTKKPSKGTLGGYEIQAGAYQDEKNAQDQLNQLLLLGYDAWILEMTRPNTITWFLVRTGSYSDRKQAEQAKARFIKDTGMDAYVRPRGRF